MNETKQFKELLRNLVRECPTALSCEDVDHKRQGDLHGAEEDCPPLCRYYKALHEATEAI